MFSIIVPSYNRKNEIPHLLASLEHQTIYNFEVIIVDDHSEDAVEIKQLYPFPVQLIRNATNLGAAESRNVGAKQAKNPWLLFLDDDDRFLPEKCERLTDVIQQHPQVNFIYHPAECVMINEGFSYFTHPYEQTDMLTLDNLLKGNKVGGMPMLAITKALFFNVKGLDTQLLSLEDYDFILKVISSPDFSAKYIPQPLTRCSFHTQRKSVSTNTENTKKAIEMIGERYIKTPEQKTHFAFNSLYMLAYPQIMNLSRQAAKYYFAMFKQSKQIKCLVIAFITLLSPKLAINMKRFIS